MGAAMLQYAIVLLMGLHSAQQGKGEQRMNARRLLATSLGHFSIDVLNSSVAMILTHLSGRFDLSIGQIGFGAMVYTIFAAMTQPVFGALADRWRGRWLAAIGVLWTAIFFVIAPLMPTYPLLLTCLAIGAWGSGAFHAAGMVNANASGGVRYPTMATSIFFLFGQTGLAVGPIVAGYYLERVGLVGMTYAALAALPVIALMFVFMNAPIADDPPAVKAAATSKATSRQTATFVATIFILLIALRATTAQSFTTLLPKFYDDLGLTPSLYGQMLGVFSFCGALGTFVGGFLGDHFNRRMVIFVSTVLSAPFCIVLLNTEGWVFFLAAGLAGALLSIPHSIILVMAQQLLPTRKGLVGGLVLGFMFASGAVSTWIAAWFADRLGLYIVLMTVALLPLGAAFCALFLPSTRNLPAPATPSEPAVAAAD
jgi:MFS transporter, FSR family, fosmidomycin resistance protein